MLTPRISLTKLVRNSVDNESSMLSNVEWRVVHDLNLAMWFPIGKMSNEVNFAISNAADGYGPPLS